ncbi:MAG: OmpA family protein [Polyangiaceae bacterium]|nr:OmpA family protein [Polyangiaceae bacterium]
MRLLAPLLTITLAMFGAACHSEEPRSPDVGLTKAVAPPKPPDLGRAPPRYETGMLYSMYLTEGVRSICSGPAPFFRFDSANTIKADPTLQTLASCMSTGPLKGRTIRLIGRTDPRGTEEYNEKLGLERAEAVKKYLVKNGVAADRVQTSSLGKDDASPSPADWPTDRRVQIELSE